MENSIKKIWKEGFTETDLSMVPQINNLDELKSVFFIDRFKNIYKKNIAVLTITGILVLLAFIMGGIPFIGLLVFALFLSLAVLGQMELNKLHKINIGASNYQFLKSFENWLDNLFLKFSSVYKLVTPLLFIAFSLAILQTNLFIPFIGETLLDRLMDSQFGIPIIIFVALAILIISILLSYFSKHLFEKEFDSIYGETIRNIKRLIEDLEALR